MAEKFPVITLTGPRQSGKTTLCKQAFPNYRYLSLENPDVLEFATNDLRGFLKANDRYVILDEAQNAPELFNYMQQRVDEANLPGQYILSGSQNFLLLEKITQSLAGRAFIMQLLPLSYPEISTVRKQPDVFDLIVTGCYPRIYDKQIQPDDFYPSYIETYVERDVRTVVNVQDLTTFRKFISLLAGQIGQLFNAASISKELGVDIKTIQRWLSVLNTSYIAFLLHPWHRNFSKRIIKTPKVYFYDTGLAANLLGIKSASDLLTSPLKGPLFENLALLEIMKSHKNRGMKEDYFFWRDSNGREIDLIIPRGIDITCVEMKASETVKPEHLKSLHYIDGEDDQLRFKHILMNAADRTVERTNETIMSWRDAHRL